MKPTVFSDTSLEGIENKLRLVRQDGIAPALAQKIAIRFLALEGMGLAAQENRTDINRLSIHCAEVRMDQTVLFMANRYNHRLLFLT